MENAHLTRFNANGTEIFVYYPSRSLRDLSPLKLNFTAPHFLVYAEKKPYDPEQARALTEKLGLDRAAAAGGGTVMIICSDKPGQWCVGDEQAYLNVLSCMNPDTTVDEQYGVGVGENYFTHEKERRIVGYPGGVHIVGVGAGADFAAVHLIRAMGVTPPPGEVPAVSPDRSPASVMLIGAGTAPCPDDSVIPGSAGYRAPLRVSALNCRVPAADGLSALGAGQWTELYSDDISGGVQLLARSFNTRYLRQAGQLIPLPDPETDGVQLRIEAKAVTTAKDNAEISTPRHVINYALYLPVGTDIYNHKLPLVLTFHGGGNTALFMAATSRWPKIAGEEGFIAVAVDRHSACPAGEIAELIDLLCRDYPCIDRERIYANGYSMGSAKCWELIEQYPDMLAGIMPMHGCPDLGVDKTPEYRTPIFYVGGAVSFLPEFPCSDAKTERRMKYMLDINRVPVDYRPDYSVNPWWGINGDRRMEIPDELVYKDSLLTVELFDSDDGMCCTAVGCGSNEGHEIYERNCRAAWEFIRHFSRKSDGSIQYK